MEIFPEGAARKLGFEALIERLHSLMLSPLGQDRLGKIKPMKDLPAVKTAMQRVLEMREAYDLDDPIPLTPMPDIRAVIKRSAVEGSLVEASDLLAVLRGLETVRRLETYFAGRHEKYPAVFKLMQRLEPVIALEKILAGVVNDFGEIRDDATPELRKIRRTLVLKQSNLRGAIQTALHKVIATGFAAEEQPTIRNGRAVIPVRAEAKRKIQGFIHDVSATGQTVYIEPAACLNLNNEVRELKARERLEVERILRDTTAVIGEHRPALKSNMLQFGWIDFLQAQAKLASDLDSHAPRLNTDGTIRIRKGKNPVLMLKFRRQKTNSGESESVIPLDLEMTAENNTLVITGPNAGGKSVAMKTVGLLSLMVVHGMPLPVEPGADFPIFEKLFIDIGDEQSIEEDLSTFSSHLTNLRHFLQNADEKTLVLMDEAGTGTDPAEGGALAQAALEHLTSAGARTIVTTHHGVLKVWASQAKYVENGSMIFDQEKLLPTYRFQMGIPGSSYAFEIADRLKLAPGVLKRARHLLGSQQVSLEKLISQFEAQNQALTKELSEAKINVSEAKSAKANFEDRLQKLRDEIDDVREQARQEALGIVRGANKRIERTIREIKEAGASKIETQEARKKLETYQAEVEKRGETVRKKKKAKKAKKVAATPAKTAPLKVGDTVVLDNGMSTGEVLEIRGKKASVAFGMMQTRVELSRLRRVAGRRKQEIKIQTNVGPVSSTGITTAKIKLDIRGKRVDEALSALTYFIDQAMSANLDRVEILHGKGTGALRQAIHTHLKDFLEVASFKEAHIEEGGAGVTIVDL